MILLIALFSDLKEFNFWGLKGKKEDKDLKKLEGKKAIKKSKGNVTKKDLADAEKNVQTQFMDVDTGNFLALSFEIERLLRIYGNINLPYDVPSNISPKKLTEELYKKRFLTEEGMDQLDAIRWVRDMLSHGREHEITNDTLNTATQIAADLYQEMYNWLYPENKIT